jgi:hypothetical protein
MSAMDPAEAMLHRLWTKAVGTPGYVKAEWKVLASWVESRLHGRPFDAREFDEPLRAGLTSAPIEPGAPVGLRALGRVYAIRGNAIEVHGTTPGAFRVGMKIVSDDNIAGTAPHAGFATVESIDEADSSVTIDSAAALNACVNDYLFEKPPTAEELRDAELERRLAAIERSRRVDEDCYRRIVVMQQGAHVIPCTAAGRLQAIAEAAKPGTEDERAPTEAERIVHSLRDLLDLHGSHESIVAHVGNLLAEARVASALRAVLADDADALRAVEGR